MLSEVIGYLSRPTKSVKFDGLLQVWAERRVAGWVVAYETVLSEQSTCLNSEWIAQVFTFKQTTSQCSLLVWLFSTVEEREEDRLLVSYVFCCWSLQRVNKGVLSLGSWKAWQAVYNNNTKPHDVSWLTAASATGQAACTSATCYIWKTVTSPGKSCKWAGSKWLGGICLDLSFSLSLSLCFPLSLKRNTHIYCNLVKK